MVSDEADVRAMCQDYCFIAIMFEHYLGWFTVMDPAKDDQVVEEIDNGDNDRSLLEIL